MKSLGTVEIETERLILRRFRSDDAGMFFENYGSDPLVTRYVSYTPCTTIGGTRQFIHNHTWSYLCTDNFYGWAIELDGELIGSISLFDLDPDSESAEIGYSLGSRWWNQGLATEAVRAVIRFAFGEVGLHRIQATCHPDNKASERVMQKNGMRFEGMMRDAQLNRDGTFSDLKLYAVLSTDLS
jgi:ribosomal-protein-alanine N-acetyltransferase